MNTCTFEAMPANVVGCSLYRVFIVSPEEGADPRAMKSRERIHAMSSMQPLALRARQAAEMLSISARHLWQLTKDGLIPHKRVGSGRRQTVLYPMESLQAWLQSAEVDRRQKAGSDQGRCKSQRGYRRDDAPR